MKSLILWVFSFLLLAKVSAQEDYCSRGSNNTIGVHYTYSPRNGDGVGMEVGITGQEKPWNFHMNVDIFYNDWIEPNKQSGESPWSGRIYNKLGYRVIRWPYKLSVYTDILGGIDYKRAFYYGYGLKFLVPIDIRAISIEPMYVDKEFNIQITFHTVI